MTNTPLLIALEWRVHRFQRFVGLRRRRLELTLSWRWGQGTTFTAGPLAELGKKKKEKVKCYSNPSLHCTRPGKESTLTANAAQASFHHGESRLCRGRLIPVHPVRFPTPTWAGILLLSLFHQWIPCRCCVLDLFCSQHISFPLSKTEQS